MKTDIHQSTALTTEKKDIESSSNATITPNPLPPIKSKSSSWKIYWRTPTQMVGLLVIGAVLAVGHHLYYNSLAGHPVGKTSQQWANRYGTGFSFLVKTFLVSAVTTAYAQQIWVTVRRKSMSLGALDAMFGATSDPFSFLSLEMVSAAKLGTYLALLSWVIPWATVVPPSTLFVKPDILPDLRGMPVHIPNFTAAERFAIFAQATVDPLIGGSGGVLYDGPFPSLSRLALVITFGGYIPSVKPPTQNASYTLSFYGPSMQCDVANSTSINILNQTMEFNPDSDVINYRSLVYTANMDEQERLLVGWVKYENGYQLHGAVCRLYNASYAVSFNFTNEDQELNLLNITTVNSTAISNFPELPEGFTGIDGLNSMEYDSSTAPEFQAISYLAMMKAFANVIIGNVSADSVLTPDTSILDTNLAYGPDLNSIYTQRDVLYPNLTVRAGIEEMWINFTISLFSTAADVITFDRFTDVTAYITSNVFEYNATDLLLAYFLSVLATTIAVLVGIRALFVNRVSHGTSFSSIMQTTRNPDLDNIVRDNHSAESECHCLGAEPLDNSLKKERLKFGVVRGHITFGLVKTGQDAVLDIGKRASCPGD